MKWTPETGHGKITAGIGDYSGNKRFLLGGVYIGRGILRERSGKKMKWKYGCGLQGAIQDWKMFSSVAEDLNEDFTVRLIRDLKREETGD